jgi:hypothetical protein
MGAITYYYMQRARAGYKPFVREIPATKGLEYAVARATEMGRPVLYTPGRAGPIERPGIAYWTQSGLTILGYVARLCAEQKTALIVTVSHSSTLPLVQEVMHIACIEAGAPESEALMEAHYLSDEQFTDAAAYIGIMHRRQCAANIWMGSRGADGLIRAEAGSLIGAYNITVARLGIYPFAITMCDYYYIGEEVFAASARITGDPEALNTIMAGDVFRVILVAIMIVGLAATQAGVDIGGWFLM